MRIVQLHTLTVFKRQTPLLRVIQPAPPSPPALQPRLSRPLRPLDPEANIDPPMHLVDIAFYPGVLACKVDFVAELLAHGGVGAQRVQRRSYDGGFLLLVVEEGEEGEGHGEDEDGEGAFYLGRD